MPGEWQRWEDNYVWEVLLLRKDGKYHWSLSQRQKMDKMGYTRWAWGTAGIAPSEREAVEQARRAKNTRIADLTYEKKVVTI